MYSKTKCAAACGWITASYVLIEGLHLVRDESPVRTNAVFDQAHNRVAVGKGGAYDLFLTRELKNAQIVCAPPGRILRVLAGLAEKLFGGHESMNSEPSAATFAETCPIA
jgi:hypothetical protein